jgi:hypothetical protein
MADSVREVDERRAACLPLLSVSLRLAPRLGSGVDRVRMPGRRCLPLAVGKELFEVLDAVRCKGDG